MEEKKNCYNCLSGGDGNEVDDRGHCYKHNGEKDFEQPPKEENHGREV